MRKIIILTEHFNNAKEVAGLAGANNAKYYSKYLALYGWQCIVISHPNSYEYNLFQDTVEIDNIPSYLQNHGSEDVVLLRINPKETLGRKLIRISKRLKTISRNRFVKRITNVISTIFTGLALLLGDSHSSGGGWGKAAFDAALKVLQTTNIDATIAITGWETPYIANKIHKRTSIPWVMIYHDPWQAFVSPIGRIFAGYYLHKYILPSASLVFHCTPHWAKEFSRELKRSVGCLINSYDTEAMLNAEPIIFPKFSIVYTGAIESADYNPRVLFGGLALLKKDISNFANKIQLIYVGTQKDEVVERAKEYGILDLVNCVGAVAPEDVLKYTKGAHLLALNLDQTIPLNIGRILAKTPEYIGSGKPILMVEKTHNNRDTDLIRLIRDTGVGWVVKNERDVASIVKNLVYIYERKKTIERPGRGKYSIGNMTYEGKVRMLSDLLNDVVMGNHCDLSKTLEFEWSMDE